MTTPNTILAGLTFRTDTIRISLSDRHHDRAEAHGLKHVDGHGSRSIFEGAPDAWLAFLADTWEKRAAVGEAGRRQGPGQIEPHERRPAGVQRPQRCRHGRRGPPGERERVPGAPRGVPGPLIRAVQPATLTATW
jgi:hypothetical protein